MKVCIADIGADRLKEAASKTVAGTGSSAM